MIEQGAALVAMDDIAVAGDALDPTALVRAVALLHGLGAAGSAGALADYARLAEQVTAAGPARDGTRAILVARLLYVPRAGLPLDRPRLGKPDVDLDEDPATCPHCPLLVSGDLPFLPVGGWFLGGVPTSAGRYVDTVARSGRLREHPLTPSCSPVEAVERLVASPAWTRVVPSRQAAYARSLVYLQAVRASSAAIPAVEGAILALAAADPRQLDETWQQVVGGTGARRLRWDTGSGRFTDPTRVGRD